MFCTKCGAILTEGSRFCTSCGSLVLAAQIPAPVAYPPPLSATRSARKPANAAVAILLVVVVVGVVIGAVVVLNIFGGGQVGTCVYVFEGQYNRWSGYTRAECEARCSEIQHKESCYWEP